MKSSLELFHLDAGKYPKPTDWIEVTYSWWLVWTQWSFWENVRINLDKINKVPKDPLKEKEYTFSVLNNNNEFELWTIMEWDTTSYNQSIINNTFASNLTTYISWNYNWIMAKVSTWTTTYVLALPSIISSDISTPTLLSIISNKSLSYNWSSNLPSTYYLYSKSWSLDFNSQNFSNIIVYNWNISSLSNSWWLQLDFIQNLQLAYSWNTLNNSDISNILKADLNNTWWTQFLAQILIQQTIDSSIIIDKNLLWNWISNTWTGTTWTWSWNSNVEISLWLTHSCLLVSWWVKYWWRNNYWQLWNWINTDSLTPVNVSGLTSWVTQISLWDSHSCAIQNWWIKCWWRWDYGQLWNWLSLNKNFPVDVTWLSSWVTDISAWELHTCAVQSWSAKCWWNNLYWRLWNWITTNSNIPVNVTWLNTWTQTIHAWSNHSCALTTWWWVKCWWYGWMWQIWDSTSIDKWSPVDVTWLTSWVSTLNWWADNNCVLTTWWWVKSWWRNDFGQMWDWTKSWKNTPTDSSWLTSGVTTLFTWSHRSCVLMNTWTTKCWWYNNMWQILDWYSYDQIKSVTY